MTSTNPDPDTLGRAQIAAMDALIDSGLGRKIRGDGNDMAAVVDVGVAAAYPLIAARVRAGERQRIAAEVRQWLADPEHASVFDDVELVDFIAAGSAVPVVAPDEGDQS